MHWHCPTDFVVRKAREVVLIIPFQKYMICPIFFSKLQLENKYNKVLVV